MSRALMGRAVVVILRVLSFLLFNLDVKVLCFISCNVIRKINADAFYVELLLINCYGVCVLYMEVNDNGMDCGLWFHICFILFYQ